MQYSLGQAGLIKPAKRTLGFGNIYEDTTGHRAVATFPNHLMPFVILNRVFVFFRCSLAVERTEIFSFPSSRIFLARV